MNFFDKFIKMSLDNTKKYVDEINKLIVESDQIQIKLKEQYKNLIIDVENYNCDDDTNILMFYIQYNLDLSRDYNDVDFNTLINKCKNKIIIQSNNTYDEGYDIYQPYYLYNKLAPYDYDVDFKFRVSKWFKIIKGYTCLDYEELIYIFYTCTTADTDVCIEVDLTYNDFEVLFLLIILLYYYFDESEIKKYKKILKKLVKCTKKYIKKKKEEYCDIDLGVEKNYFKNNFTSEYRDGVVIINNNKIKYLNIIQNLVNKYNESSNKNYFIQTFINDDNITERLKYLSNNKKS